MEMGWRRGEVPPKRMFENAKWLKELLLPSRLDDMNNLFCNYFLVLILICLYQICKTRKQEGSVEDRQPIPIKCLEAFRLVSNMSQMVKALVCIPDDLNLIPGTHSRKKDSSKLSSSFRRHSTHTPSLSPLPPSLPPASLIHTHLLKRHVKHSHGEQGVRLSAPFFSQLH